MKYRNPDDPYEKGKLIISRYCASACNKKLGRFCLSIKIFVYKYDLAFVKSGSAKNVSYRMVVRTSFY